jgi:hypothetical protein
MTFESRSELLTTTGNVSVALVIFVVPFALCVLLHSRESETKRFERLQLLMLSTALLLVSGAVQVSVQSRWPALFFDDSTNLDQIAQIALSRGLLVGSVFSTALAFIFLPAGATLHAQAFYGKDNNDIASRWSWFTQLFSVLAPLIAAVPISKLFEL